MDPLITPLLLIAAVRPSTMGAATSFAVEGATAAALWVAIEPT